MPAITWDINLTTIFVFFSGCIAFYVGVLRTSDRVRAAEEAIDEWKTSYLGLKAEFYILKDQVLREYLPRVEFDDKFERLFAKLDQYERNQTEALNRLDDRLVNFMAGRPLPPPPPSRR